MTDQATVIVIVGGVTREFPAHYESRDDMHGTVGRMAGPVLTPDSRDGWLFRQTVDGQWYGTETGR